MHPYNQVTPRHPILSDETYTNSPRYVLLLTQTLHPMIIFLATPIVLFTNTHTTSSTAGTLTTSLPFLDAINTFHKRCQIQPCQPLLQDRQQPKIRRGRPLVHNAVDGERHHNRHVGYFSRTRRRGAKMRFSHNCMLIRSDHLPYVKYPHKNSQRFWFR